MLGEALHMQRRVRYKTVTACFSGELESEIMITEEDYLKAKKVVIEYESKQLKQGDVSRQVCEHGGFPFSLDHMCKEYDQCITGVRSRKVKECCIDWATKRKLAGKP